MALEFFSKSLFVTERLGIHKMKFNHVATVPSEDLAVNQAATTVEENCIFSADPDDPSKTPLHYEFDLICSDFADYFKNLKKLKKYVFVTFHTQEFKITENIIIQDIKQFTAVYMKLNLLPSVKVQIGSNGNQSTPVSCKTPKKVAQTVAEFLENTQFQENNCLIIKFLNNPTFSWFIVQFSMVNDHSSSAQFIEALKGNKNVESPDYKAYQELSKNNKRIVVNFMFTVKSSYKLKKNLLKLIEHFGGKSSLPQNRSRAGALDEDEKEKYQPQEINFGEDFDWEEFIRIKSFIMKTDKSKDKGETKKKVKKIEINKQKLVFVAQKAANSVDCSPEIMQKIIAELDKQISVSKQFEEKANQNMDNLDFEYEEMKKEKDELTKQYDKKRKEYLRLHKQNEEREIIKRDEKIGFDDDVDFTIEMLENEIENATKEINYIKTAFEDLDKSESNNDNNIFKTDDYDKSYSDISDD